MIYLDKKFLNWKLFVSSWEEIDIEVRARAEVLLDRSESHLNANQSKDSRADCLLTLKRSLNQRLKALEEIHEFKKLDISDKPKGYFELMEKIGIVRPLLLKKLLKIRNNIEHEDIDPPSYNQCKEYVDVVWYFLKSTNRHVSIKATGLEFNKLNRNGMETQYCIGLDLKDNHLKRVEVMGLLPKSYLRKSTRKHNYLLLDAKEIFTKEEQWSDSGHHRDLISTDTSVVGHLELADTQRLEIVRRIMNA